jgi:hypothetical protein
MPSDEQHCSLVWYFDWSIVNVWWERKGKRRRRWCYFISGFTISVYFQKVYHFKYNEGEKENNETRKKYMYINKCLSSSDIHSDILPYVRRNVHRTF